MKMYFNLLNEHNVYNNVLNILINYVHSGVFRILYGGGGGGRVQIFAGH